MKPRLCKVSFLVALVAVLSCCSIQAQMRRALLIGIDNYRPATEMEKEQAWKNGMQFSGRSDYAFRQLKGAVNDAEALRDILVHNFAFSPENIQVLENEAATRQAILDSIRKIFIDEAHEGDVLVFFFAGHGSQVKNSLSYKPDKLDETIVPWDANAGVWDIRDKELARLFNEVLDRHKVILTAIFDSCHSGSIARGLTSPVTVRSVSADERDAKDNYHATPPEDRGALIVSSAQYDEEALEDLDVHGGKSIPHGAFTLALLRTLNRMPPGTTVREIVRTVRAALHASGFRQEPVLAGTKERLASGIFGEVNDVKSFPKVLVQDITPEGRILLDSGYSLGLERNAELKKIGAPREPELRIKVITVNGLSNSLAEPLNKKDLTAISNGDAFVIDRWAFPGGAKFAVWFPPANLALGELEQAVETFSKLSRVKQVKWVTDPAEVTPTHVISWTGSKWQLQTPSTTEELVGTNPEQIIARLNADNPGEIRLFIYVPPPSELKNKLSLGPASNNSAIDFAPSSLAAKYWLVGRIAGQSVEYSWIRPNATRKGSETEDLPLVVRSDWLNIRSEGAEKISDKLVNHLQGIGRVVGWLSLSSPPTQIEFPYKLALQDVDTGGWITGNELQPANGTLMERSSRIATPTVRGGQQLHLVLRADADKLKKRTRSQKVYVFGIDSFGGCVLLFPREADDQRSLLPMADAEGKYPQEIPIGDVRVKEPWGVDTYIMLTTEHSISDLTVFDCNAVRTRLAFASTTTNDPLADLLRRNGSNLRNWNVETPANWSIQRLSVRSVPGKEPAHPKVDR